MANYDHTYIEPELLELASKYPVGLILVGGTAFSGITTTATNLMVECSKANAWHKAIDVSNRYDYNDADSGSVISIEVARDPYQRLIRAAMANDPDVIFLGEIRDKAKGNWSTQIPLSGTKAIAELHAYSVASSLERYCELIDKSQLPRLHNVLVVSQFLLTRKDGKKVAVREFLALDPELLQALADSDNLKKTAYVLSQTHGQSFYVSALKLHAKGWISDEEMAQVLDFHKSNAAEVGF